MITIDVKKLVLRFGGRAELLRRLQASQLGPITVEGVDKWFERSSIPIRRLLDLLVLADREGERLDLYAYLIQKGKHDDQHIGRSSAPGTEQIGRAHV